MNTQLFDKDQLNIEEIFKKFYEVPDYQREYVWRKANVLALLNDIYCAFKENAQNAYFIGTTVVATNLKSSSLEVIDGQQRLTTLFILLSIFTQKVTNDRQQFLNDLIKNKSWDSFGDLSSRYHLNLNYANAQKFLEIINTQPSNLIKQLHSDYGNRLPDTIKNLYNAYQQINDFLDEHCSSAEELFAFITYTLHQVFVLQITTDINKALQIFETINERGVGLNPLDLIKNRLFCHIDKKDFKILKDKWQEIFKLFRKNETHKLRFIRYFLMANFPDKIDSGIYKNGIIRTDDIFDFTSNLEDISKPQDFLQNLYQAALDYNGFLEGKLNGEDNEQLQNINTLNGGLSTYIIALLSAKNLPLPILKHFIKQVESFMFFYIIPGNNTNALERECASWAKQLYSLSKIQNEEEQLSSYNKFITSALITPTQQRMNNFDDYFRRLQMGKNRTRTRYILNKISLYVQEKWNGCHVSSNLFSGLDIEHILPNHPKEGLREAFGVEIYEEYKNRLGNLTLLEAPLNRSLGNDFFEIKKQTYTTSNCVFTKSIIALPNTTGATSQHGHFFQYIPHWDVWTKESIEQRQELLLKLTKKVWPLEIYTK